MVLPGGDALQDGRDRGVLGLGDEGQGLAVLIAAEAAIPPVLFPVGRLHVAAERGAINFDLARHHGTDILGRHGFAQFVGQDEGRLVLDVQVAAQLEGGHALGAVAEDGDGQQGVAHLQLAARENRGIL
jgi:hypothetical protein